jgi:hypothetical protein
VAVRLGHLGVSEEVVRRLGGHLLFGGPEEILAWTRRLERGEARIERWQVVASPVAVASPVSPDLDGLLLPLAVVRGKKVFPVDESVTLRRGDRLYAAITEERREEIKDRLQRAGWEHEVGASLEGSRTGADLA